MRSKLERLNYERETKEGTFSFHSWGEEALHPKQPNQEEKTEKVGMGSFFYGISTFMGYLRPKPFFNWTVKAIFLTEYGSSCLSQGY